LANSPYIVTGNILVNQGVTLTIEPGVTVKFNKDLYMYVDGTLIARGIEGNLITFTSIAIDKSHFQLERTHLNIQGEVSGERFGLSQNRVSELTKECIEKFSAKQIDTFIEQGKTMDWICSHYSIDAQLAWAIRLQDKSD